VQKYRAICGHSDAQVFGLELELCRNFRRLIARQNNGTYHYISVTCSCEASVA